MKNLLTYFALVWVISSCASNEKELSQEEMMSIVKELDNQFRQASNSNDGIGIGKIYSENAKFVPDNEPFLRGGDNMIKYWEDGLKQGLKNVDLTPLTVDGTKDIIYETGRGTTELWDLTADTLKHVYRYKYVNIWRLQEDGSYKLDVDTYTGHKDQSVGY